MNISNLPVDGGAFQYGSVWAVQDLRVTIADGLVTLRPCTNVSNPADPFWVKPNGSGNKQMEANWYVDTRSLIGEDVVFSGNTVDYTLPTNYVVRAFIKVFSEDYSSLLQQGSADITNGNQTFQIPLSVTHPDSAHVRYGLAITGPNAPAGNNPAANGFVSIRANALDPYNILINPGFEEGTNGWGSRFYLTSDDHYYSTNGSAGSNVSVYEGRYVDNFFASSVYTEAFLTEPGSVFTASIKALTPSIGRITGRDGFDVWVRFINAQRAMIAEHYSSAITAESPADTWIELNVTNYEGGLELVAPPGTKWVEYWRYAYSFGENPGFAFMDDAKLRKVSRSDPAILIPPSTVTRSIGQIAAFSTLTASAKNVTYTWQREIPGLPTLTLSEDEKYSGTRTANLVIRDVQKSDAGEYWLVVSNQFGSTQAMTRLIVQTPQEAKNLLRNGGFETGEWNPWGSLDRDFYVNPPGTGFAHEGFFSAMLWPGTAPMFAQMLPARVGRAYTASAWVYLSRFSFPSGRVLLRLDLNRIGEGSVSYDSPQVEIPLDTWTKISVTNGIPGPGEELIVAPSKTYQAAVSVIMASQDGRAFIDDVTLREFEPMELIHSVTQENISLSFATESDAQYEVIYKSNLHDAVWTLAETISGDGAVKTATYPPPTSQRFYTVRKK